MLPFFISTSPQSYGGNMKRFLITLVLATVLAIPSFANNFNISLSGGYTTLIMAKVNEFVQSIQNSAGGWGTVTNLNSGYYAALDANFTVLPSLTIGPRIEFVNAMAGEYNFSGYVPTFGQLSFTDSFGASLIPILLGISYSTYFPHISVKYAVYGGYGFAAAYNNASFFMPASGQLTENIPLSGSGLVGEILVSGDYSFARFFSIGLNLGFRMANIPQMKAAKDVPPVSGISNIPGASGIYGISGFTSGITKGSVFKDQATTGNDLPFDYSGLMTGLAFNFSF